MKTILFRAGALLFMSMIALSVQAGGVSGGNANSSWTIYGWQYMSYQFVDNDNGREFDRITGNASNIGFAATIDTGVSLGGTAIKANVQCEQFAFYDHIAGGTGWCNRNSKLSLSGAWGEIGFAIWLLPFNEMVAQWVDPFYDANSLSHTSIMGTHGLAANFYNGGTFDDTTFGGDFDYGNYTIFETSFNRRQENLIHWWSPNWNGFNARFAITAGNRNDANNDLDPKIISTGVTYTTDIGEDNLWLALTYEEHDEWVAASNNHNARFVGESATEPGGQITTSLCSDSDDDAWRVAGRYIHSWGNGHSTTLSAMYEELSWDLDCEGTPTKFDDLEVDHWMISGKHDFPGPWDVRFSYMDADEYECGSASLAAGACTENDTDAYALNVGLQYTMPAGTELRFAYGKVDNENNGTYDFGIRGSGSGAGDSPDFYEIGLVQWF